MSNVKNHDKLGMGEGKCVTKFWIFIFLKKKFNFDFWVFFLSTYPIIFPGGGVPLSPYLKPPFYLQLYNIFYRVSHITLDRQWVWITFSGLIRKFKNNESFWKIEKANTKIFLRKS